MSEEEFPEELKSLSGKLGIRVECVIYAPDEEGPVRVVISGPDGEERVRYRVTPRNAYNSAYTVARIMSSEFSPEDCDRIAAGLREAAVLIWAARN